MSTEAEFAACLLMVGPPRYLKSRTPHTVQCPYMWRVGVNEWWHLHIFKYGSIGFSTEFERWYEAYKWWLLGDNHD